jgi:dihydroorotase
MAAPGIAGLETALGLLLSAVDAGRLPLSRVIAALTSGPARVLGPVVDVRPRLRVGAAADLVVFDRTERWTVGPSTLRTLAAPSPLAGLALPGSILFVLAGGCLAWETAEA